VTDALNWRWIFLVKVPVVLAVTLIAIRVVAADPPRPARRSYDLAGAGSSALGLLALVFVITQLADRSVAPALVAALAVAAVVLLVGFLRREGRVADPLLPLDFFALRTPRAADLASLTVLAAPFGFSFLATLFLQRVQHHSALETGLALLPGAVLSAVVSRYAAPVLVNRLGLRASAVGGLLVVAAGFAMLLRMDPEVTYVAMMLPASIVCLGLGMGVAYPVFTVAAVTDVPDDRQGLAAGIQSTALQVGGGFGLAVVSAAVAAGGGGTADVASLRAGALVGMLLPLCGAIVAFGGLRETSRELQSEAVEA